MESEDIGNTLAIIALPLHKSSPVLWQGRRVTISDCIKFNLIHSSIQEPHRRQERHTAVISRYLREKKN
jgi:hypothetical protein